MRKSEFGSALNALNEELVQANSRCEFDRIPVLWRKIVACYIARDQEEAAASALSNLGDFHLSRGQLRRAHKSFKQALALQPNNPILMRRLDSFNFQLSKAYVSSHH